ncbi:hypothetical protein GCM10007391_13030 [Alteromonas halophila]|uniref:ABC transmembrane type-1 domain-containing protein n=2 Tax=Alteromonas halophila TaxID=516698 RepID=A0A918MXF1_9ALTE|nr:hypothetical protein GCM10007391_13030 [Alteromonas halophila]
MNSDNKQTTARRTRKDNLVKIIVTGFGGLVLLTLVVLITHLLMQAFPLVLSPSFEQQALPDYSSQKGGPIVATGDLLEGQPLVVRSPACALSAKSLNSGVYQQAGQVSRPCTHALDVVSSLGQQYIVDISPAGQVRIQTVRGLTASDSAEVATGAYSATLSAPAPGGDSLSFAIPADTWQDRQSWHVRLSEQWVVTVINTSEQVYLWWVNRKTPTEIVTQTFPVSMRVLPLPGSRQTAVYDESTLRFHAIRDAHKVGVQLEERDTTVAVRLDAPMTWWQSLEKDRTLFIADTQGQLTRWTLRSKGGQMRFAPTYTITDASLATPQAIRDHASTNMLALLTRQGEVALLNRITGETVALQQIGQGFEDIQWYGNRLYANGKNKVAVWDIDQLSGVTTWSSLFEPQQYEGYPTASTVWQTTNASDYLEAKYSITPLLIGSLKASLLALLVAIPISLCAAVYTAFFARSRLRHVLKPAIEMLEAVPSVLIGFIAAIWLSPVAGQFLFSFVFFLITVPVILLILALFQHRLSLKLPVFMRHSSELVISLLGIVLLGYISVEWAPWLLEGLFGIGSLEQLSDNTQSPIGKSTLVVAIALGIAISPSIYSLTEDAISGVPESLKHASYALGATRLQTLMHVVIQVATPGILAAVMLGFGRAFGETMIVLMATGNTPVSSWSLFEGLRALTANLAIELPEADVDSAHYHILFFTACILFGFTFVVNTLAEFLRRRLRSRAYRG